MLRRAECSLVNELGNHILVDSWLAGDAVTIRLAGPTSVSENTLTWAEASEVHKQLGYLLALNTSRMAPPAETT